MFHMLTANDTSLKRADYLVLLLNIYSVKVTLPNRGVPFLIKRHNVLVVELINFINIQVIIVQNPNICSVHEIHIVILRLI